MGERAQARLEQASAALNVMVSIIKAVLFCFHSLKSLSEALPQPWSSRIGDLLQARST